MVFSAISGVSASHALVDLRTFEDDCTLVYLIPKANYSAIMLLFVPVASCNFAQPEAKHINNLQAGHRGMALV